MEDSVGNSMDKTEHLSLIQGNIGRMSTSSALFKGFAATILAGVVTIAFRDIHTIVLLLMALPLLAFLMLDVYYLRLERRYRYLYELVRKGVRAADFSMDVRGIDQSKARASVCECLSSPSIVLFYAPVFLAFGIMVGMKVCGVQ